MRKGKVRKMKNKNPYLSCIMLWIIVIFINLTACIFGVINGILWQAFFNLAIVMIDCIYLGWCIRRFNEFREFEKMKKSLKEFIDNMDKMKENEPFKEFENNGKSSSRKV